MHRSIWKRLCETLVNRSEAPSPTSHISPSPLQSLRLFTSISTTSSDSETDSDNRPRPSSAVLRFFQDCGFSQTQAQSIVSRYPQFLNCDNPEKTLKPKIIFLHSIGIHEPDIAKMVTQSPLILHRSLNDHLIPSFDSLKSLLGGELNAISSLKRCPALFQRDPDALAANLSTLRKLGVPESNILKMMINNHYTRVLGSSNRKWFRKIVEVVTKMGFDTSSVSFCIAVSAMGLCTESSWEDRIKFYQGLGFSREEIFSMFRKQPTSLLYSWKKVREAVEFYHDKFCWGPSELAMRPILLTYSLNKRVIPRCSVAQVLWSRSTTKKSLRLVTVLKCNDKVFLETYVKEYEDEFPEVMDAYQGKLSFKQYNFDSGR